MSQYFMSAAVMIGHLGVKVAMTKRKYESIEQPAIDQDNIQTCIAKFTSQSVYKLIYSETCLKRPLKNRQNKDQGPELQCILKVKQDLS